MAQSIKTPTFEVEQGGCRQKPPSILRFGGSCSSINSSFEPVYDICRLQTADCRPQTADRRVCRPQTADRRLYIVFTSGNFSVVSVYITLYTSENSQTTTIIYLGARYYKLNKSLRFWFSHCALLINNQHHFKNYTKTTH